MSMSLRDANRIGSAISYLQELCDVKGHACGVAPEHKEAVRLYVESWILPLLEAARAQEPARYDMPEQSGKIVRRARLSTEVSDV